MGEAERERFVSAALVRTGYLRDEGDGPNPALSEAIARYQAENDLVPNGRVDFDLYYRMLANEARPPGGHDSRSAAGPGRMPRPRRPCRRRSRRGWW